MLEFLVLNLFMPSQSSSVSKKVLLKQEEAAHPFGRGA
jgi:hypothetical protein